MKKIMLSFFLMSALFDAKAQYQSFFADSTWEWHILYLTNIPEDYINYPPEEPNPLGVYCKTYVYKFSRNYWSHLYGDYMQLDDGFEFSPGYYMRIQEDTTTGRLSNSWKHTFCDMSLSVGDTFVYYQGCTYGDF